MERWLKACLQILQVFRIYHDYTIVYTGFKCIQNECTILKISIFFSFPEVSFNEFLYRRFSKCNNKLKEDYQYRLAILPESPPYSASEGLDYKEIYCKYRELMSLSPWFEEILSSFLDFSSESSSSRLRISCFSFSVLSDDLTSGTGGSVKWPLDTSEVSSGPNSFISRVIIDVYVKKHKDNQ